MTIGREMIEWVEVHITVEYNAPLEKNESELYPFTRGNVFHALQSEESNSKEKYLV